MVTRTVLALVSAATLFLVQQNSSDVQSGGQDVQSVTQRYRAEVEDTILEQGAGEVIATLQLLQNQLSRNDQAMKDIAANVDEANKVLGGINQTLEDIVEKKITNGKFVSKQDMDDAITAVKNAATEAAKTASSEDGTDGTGCNCNARFVEIIQRLEALENVTGLTTSMYGGVTGTNGRGSFGSLAKGYQTTTTSYQSVSGTRGGGSFGSTQSTSQETRKVRVVQPRQVTDYEVPVPDTTINVVESMPATCTMRDPITGECLQSTAVTPVAEVTEQGRFPLLNRLRGR